MFAIKGCEEKHSHTAAHHPVVKPPAVVSTAVSHTPTQQQGWGNYYPVVYRDQAPVAPVQSMSR